MKKQKTAPAESAVQTEKKGTGIQIDKKTVFGITALLLVIMLLAGVLTQVVPRGEYQMDDSGMVINGTYHEFAGDEGKDAVVEDNPRADNGVHFVADNNGNWNRCVHCSHRRNISYTRPQRRAQIYNVLGRQKV
jgi:hypothetical protein